MLFSSIKLSMCTANLQGFNAVLTEPVDTPDRRGEDQIREVELKLNPDLKSTLMELCCDPKTTVLSGSNKFVLDNNFYWIDCIKPVFEYFTERTPQSQFELGNTSLVWNYKYADVKFGRVQAIDLLQHLCESLSNAHVDVIQGSRSVDLVFMIGAGIYRILEEIAYNSVSTQIDYVLCIGHFLGKDEDLYTYFDPELPAETPRTTSEALKFPGDRMSDLKLQNSGSVSKASHVTSEQPLPNSGKKTLWNVLDLMMENYFSCTVDRTQSRAHYSLGSSDDVVSLLKALAAASSSS
ncbi:hypothetical protein POM88_007438 [Heracleum sosnowskyi]|uniref:Uncharacterized protein n=1 Tax=Heracleum sosnowskyi TaxID=360622 RepID=A0AAD8N0W8_9APIA|nr:hypothetical protein POM88_007438 [Heracleum sosnowskyi]